MWGWGGYCQNDYTLMFPSFTAIASIVKADLKVGPKHVLTSLPKRVIGQTKAGTSFIRVG